MRFGRILLIMTAALAISGSARTSHAALNAVDPGPYTAAFGFYPAWYQDTYGRGLELCLSRAVGPNGALCVLLPVEGFDPAFPVVFPTNFPDETFWFAADAAVTAAGVDIRYVAAVEAAFANGPVLNGDQVSFARIRFFGDVSVPGTYTITHPYGVEVFEVTEVTAGREIRFTRDIGVGATGSFNGALAGDIGPFLISATGIITAVNPDTLVSEIFIGDPNVTQAVTGSPFGTNFLRVEGPGIDEQTDQFFLAGKISPVALSSPLIVDRTTYGRTAGGTQVDVFATSAPTATLSFDDVPPPLPPAPSLMGGDAVGRFFGQELNPAALPASVAVTADNPTLNNSPVTQASAVTDVVSITRVEYSGGTLTIEASSSDEVPLPTLTAGVFGNLNPPIAGSIQTLTVPGLTIPPATVTVTSSAGGSDTEEVVVLP